MHCICQTASAEQWYYDPSEQNPADLATKSVSASQLVDTVLFKSPDFLNKPPEPETHELFELIEPEMDVEVRPQVTALATQIKARRLTSEHFESISTWDSLPP